MKCNEIPSGTQWENLSSRQLDLYRAHLESCPGCRTRVFSEAPEQFLFELQDPAIPEEFWLGFWDSLERKLDPAEPPSVSIYFRYVRWAAVFVFVLILSLYSRGIQEPVPAPNTQAISMQTVDLSGYPLVEEVQNPKVRYYIFQPKGNENIVMMFDPDMEL